MKHQSAKPILTACVAILSFCLLASGAFAQGSTRAKAGRGDTAAAGAGGDKSEAGASGKVDIKITKLTGLDKNSIIKTPEFRTSVGRGSSKPLGEWVQVMAIFDTQGDWIDELTVQFYVMTEKKEGGKKAYTLFKQAVRCFDVKKGRDHMCAVYLRPPALDRFGSVAAVAVEIAAGDVKDEKSDTAVAGLSKTWWRDPKIVEAEIVTSKDGYLLNKFESPFAYINFDDYEASK